MAFVRVTLDSLPAHLAALEPRLLAGLEAGTIAGVWAQVPDTPTPGLAELLDSAE